MDPWERSDRKETDVPATDRFSIEGRTALVTGASYGLGEVIAKGASGKVLKTRLRAEHGS